MKIYLKTEDEIELMRQANQLVGATLGELARHIKPGVTTLQLDKVAEAIVLIEVVEVSHLRAIVPQFRRQESFEPGCFVDALFADEYEYVLVDDVILHPRSDHSDEPFGEDLYP